MSRLIRVCLTVVAVAVCFFGCSEEPVNIDQQALPRPTPTATPIPPTLSEIVDDKNSDTESRLGKFDFLNFTYPLPRGWQDIDSKEITLVDGIRRMTEDKIGMSFVTKKFGDVTGDGKDEAFVFLRVRTGGSATPHIVYVFSDGPEEAEIIWYFRTGDRSDGGLKRVYAEDGDLIVELFGQDRYIFDQMETLRIVGDEPQLCCPDSFTRNRYKRTATGFTLKDKRLTYSLADPSLPPQENLGEKTLRESRGKN